MSHSPREMLVASLTAVGWVCGFASLVLILLILTDAPVLKVLPPWLIILPLIGFSSSVAGLVLHRSRSLKWTLAANSLAIVLASVLIWRFLQEFENLQHLAH
jgi:hypothetical protein